MTENAKTPEIAFADTINRIQNDSDDKRLQSFCSLVNTFNHAVQVQAGRNQWEPSDFRLFAIALCAMDQIGLQTKPRIVSAANKIA